jgi:hypothetical protein
VLMPELAQQFIAAYARAAASQNSVYKTLFP